MLSSESLDISSSSSVSSASSSSYDSSSYSNRPTRNRIFMPSGFFSVSTPPVTISSSLMTSSDSLNSSSSCISRISEFSTCAPLISIYTTSLI